jgi:hypothetical protein
MFLLEELDDGTFDDDECVFLVKSLVAIFHIVAALPHNEYTGGCLPVEKIDKGSIWRVEFIYYYNYFFRGWSVGFTR